MVRQLHLLAVMARIVSLEDDSFPGWARVTVRLADGSEAEIQEKLTLLGIGDQGVGAGLPPPAAPTCRPPAGQARRQHRVDLPDSGGRLAKCPPAPDGRHHRLHCVDSIEGRRRWEGRDWWALTAVDRGDVLVAPRVPSRNAPWALAGSRRSLEGLDED